MLRSVALNSYYRVYNVSRTQKNIFEVQPGRSAQFATEVVEEMITADQQLVDIATAASGCWHGSAYNNVHDHFKLPKVCSRWVPRELTDTHKMD